MLKAIGNWILRVLFSVPLATTVEDIQAQADAFLSANGFPINQKYRQIFGQYVQMLPAEQAHYFPKDAATMIRKAEANEAAYFGLIKPPAAQPAPEPTDDKASTKSTSSEVEKEIKG